VFQFAVSPPSLPSPTLKPKTVKRNKFHGAKSSSGALLEKKGRSQKRPNISVTESQYKRGSRGTLSKHSLCVDVALSRSLRSPATLYPFFGRCSLRSQHPCLLGGRCCSPRSLLGSSFDIRGRTVKLRRGRPYRHTRGRGWRGVDLRAGDPLPNLMWRNGTGHGCEQSRNGPRATVGEGVSAMREGQHRQRRSLPSTTPSYFCAPERKRRLCPHLLVRMAVWHHARSCAA
jgi:hypothetical protein